MKRATALKNISKITDKLHAINGIYCAPLCYRDFVKVKRVWVFGSVAKGSESPNDLDIFVEVICTDRRRKYQRKVYRSALGGGRTRLHGGFRVDKSTLSRTVPSPPSGISEFCKWLRAGTKKTSLHFVHDDEVFERLDCKYLIYPRNDFASRSE